MNVKSVEISNELCQRLLGLQIYPNFAQNSESESLAGRSKRITSKVDFNVIRDPNIPLGFKNYGETVCFFNSAIQILYSLPVFILIYKKKSTAGVSSTFELISETAETVIRQSALLELEKQKAKLAMDQQKQKTNSTRVKSPLKRKSKFRNRNSRENDEKRKKFMRDNFGEDEKEELKKVDKKRKKNA